MNLPPKFNQKLRFSINDIDHHVAVRNIALLLFALNVDEGADSRHQPEAAISRAEDLLHLWYSAFVPATTLRRFEIAGKELVEEFCRQLDDLPMQDTHEKTWNFQSGATLKVSLSKENWLNLRSLFKQTSKVNYKEAVLVRKSICLAPSRSDYRDRWNFKESSPFMRLSSEKFRSDGLLLPFAHPRSTFTEPNP